MIERFSIEDREKYIPAVEFLENLKLADWSGGPIDAADGRVHIGLINPTLLPGGKMDIDLDVARYRSDAIHDLQSGDPKKARGLINALADGLRNEWPDADEEAVERFKARISHIQEVLGR